MTFVKIEIVIISIVLSCILAGIVTGFMFYNAGYADGVARTYQQISKCTIQDAHLEKCFIPCSTDMDCVEKNGMKDH